MHTRTLSRRALDERDPLRSRAWWPWLRRGASLVFFAVVLAMLARYAQHIDWDDVVESLRSMPPSALLVATLLAAVSHLLYSCFDLIGKRYTGHHLTTLTVMAVTFVSYAFNLCIGSLVGGVGFRYRLYTRLGLPVGVVTRVVSLSMLTNWLGYTLIAGLAFLLQPLALPPSWNLGNQLMQWVGALLVFTSLAYIAACVKWGNQSWTLRGHEVNLPPWRMAVLQLAISCVNWSVMAGVVFVLLGQRVPYADVLTVLLIGAVAGVIAHVPAGLGIFEFVFVALLSHVVSEGRSIAALLGYRAIYYVAPLLLATVLYVMMEVRARAVARRSPRGL